MSIADQNEISDTAKSGQSQRVNMNNRVVSIAIIKIIVVSHKTKCAEIWTKLFLNEQI